LFFASTLHNDLRGSAAPGLVLEADMTWNFRVLRYEDGTVGIFEVFY